MSEELGYNHAAAGLPVEPALSPTTPGNPQPSFPLASSSSTSAIAKRKFVPGGGSALASGDQPGDPFATLIVLPADHVVGTKPSAGKLPTELHQALASAIGLIETASRSVVIVAGGETSTALMTQMVLRMPGGLDSFGPGRRVHALLKERSAPWGELWESALLTKALAKRQASTVRFGSVVVLTAPCLTAQTLRVYRHVFSDWRVLVDGGRGRGGRDAPLDVRVVTVEAPPSGGSGGDEGGKDERLLARAAALDETWFRDGLEKWQVHPWWPKEQVTNQEEEAPVVGRQAKRRG